MRAPPRHPGEGCRHQFVAVGVGQRSDHVGQLVGRFVGAPSRRHHSPVRAIVRGDVAVIQAVAARDQLPVHRVLDGLVVVEATPEQLAALRHVSGILSISRDALVAPFMTVSQKAIAADQARARDIGFSRHRCVSCGDRQGRRRGGDRLGYCRVAPGAVGQGRVLPSTSRPVKRPRATALATARTSPASSPDRRRPQMGSRLSTRVVSRRARI